MTIRETIDSAKDSYGFSVHNLLIYDDDAMYYFKVFDPEHVALMESVVEAVAANRDGKPTATYAPLSDLEDYRREHGLV